MYRMVTRNKREYIQKMMSEIDKEDKKFENLYSNFTKGLGRNTPDRINEYNISDIRIQKNRTTLKKFGKQNHN
jgi:hypothetical protein